MYNANWWLGIAPRNNTGQEAVIIDMGDLSDITNKDKKTQDTLFGPNIGVVTSGPAWTEASEKEKKPTVDNLTPEVVKGWIAKSKEVSGLFSATLSCKAGADHPLDIPTDYNIASSCQPQTSHPSSIPFVDSTD
jgi:hypothetical protein